MKKKIALLQGGFNGEVMKYVMRGIRKRIQEENADLYIFSCYGGENEDPLYNAGEYNIFTLINYDDYDGFIMASNNITSGEEREKLRQKLVACGKPVVSMEHDLEGLHYVGCDNYYTVREMTEHMITEHDCKKIFFIGGPDDNYETNLRMLGAKDAMAAAGLELKPEWIRHYNYTYQDGYQAFHDFQKDGFGLPDCVIAANDEMAVGYCAAAGELELYAPRDFRIGGFDNSRFSETYRPRLTTVDREKVDAGYHSCDILFRLIEGEDVPQKTTLKSTVIYRESCGCPTQEDSLIYGRRHIIESMLTQDHLRANVQMMHKDLVQCSDWNEFAIEMEKYTTEIQCSAMYILMNKQDYLRPYSEKLTVQTGFDDELSVLYAWEDGMRVSYRDLVKVRELFSGNHESESSHSYLILPIHFQEKEIGYCVIKDSLTMVDNQSLFSWSHSLNMSMEIMLERLALKQANAVLDALCVEDPMTGVFNRAGLTRHAERILQLDRMQRKSTLIVFADVNRLKMINDTYGHKSGDIAITTVANVLKKICPKDSTVVRYGGDEFVMVISNRNAQTGINLKEYIKNELVEENEKQELPFTISASIGCVLALPDETLTLEEYVKKADAIMYVEKQKRK